MRRDGSKFLEMKQDLKHGIEHRHFKDMLPSEKKLADKFNVSRTTTRKVLRALESEGLIERVQGKGTFIKKQDVSTGYFKIQPSKQHADQHNANYSCKILDLQMLDAPPAEIIPKLEYDQKTVFVRRMHFFDDVPARYEIRYLRGDLCGGIFWEDLEQISIHECLVSKYDLPLTKVWQRMTSKIMPKEITKIFDEPEPYPAFHIERITYTYKKPITAVEYFIRGELVFEDTYEPQSND